MPKPWNGRHLIASVCLLALVMLLAACSRPGPQQSLAPQHTFARDGGIRLTLRVSCLPDASTCDLEKQRDAAVGVIARRLGERKDLSDPVVRGDGSDGIVVELPDVASGPLVGDITALVTTRGRIEILDTGDDSLVIGSSTVGKTCADTCDAGQYPVIFTGDQIDRSSVAAQQDRFQAGKWVVLFRFSGSSRQQFADYTASHIGRYLTITANDVVVMSSVIQSEIEDTGQITVMDENQARRLAAYLMSGSLPATIAVVSTEQAQPSAG